jgi:hypothetical protein
LQKEYARKLLRDHVNPYTKLAYANDPAVVMLEIYNESGLYMKRGTWRQMPSPYAADFQKLWNAWLTQRYGTTAKLAAVWGAGVLQPGESLEDGTIQVPFMGLVHTAPAEQRAWLSAPRRNDGAQFAHNVHTKYFREMRSYLRSIGVRIPVSATGRFEDISDASSMSRELDFIASSFYYDHPYWGTGKPTWQPPSFYHNRNPITETGSKSLAPTMALGRVKGLPFVVREWNYCWPNRNRAAGMIEAASYAALHDVDAMILFTYEVVPTPRVFYFNVRSDPARWGLCGVAAQVFLKGLVKPAANRVVVPYNDVDTFTYNEYSSPLYELSWNTRLENDFTKSNYQADQTVSLIVPPGRSSTGTYTGAPAVLWTSNLARDLSGNTLGAPAYLNEYSLPAVPDGDALRFSLPLLQTQARTTLGADEKRGLANGFVDAANKRLVYGTLNPNQALGSGREALRLFGKGMNTRVVGEPNVALSDTGELWRDAGRGRLVVSTEQFQALCGH